MLAAPTIADLALFTGRPQQSFTPFADQALEQAALMFTVGTKLTDYPDDPDKAKLARFAILEMADVLLLEQPFAQVKASPFQSESIGSYSYSKSYGRISSATSLRAAAQGIKTGLFWWDTAIEQLAVLEQTVSAHGSIKVHVDGLVRYGDGDLRVVDEAQREPLVPYIRIS